jgi:prepilin-type processing-associated H-X9-DG protein
VTNNQVDANGGSGLGWSAFIMAYMEERAAFMKTNFNVSITNQINTTVREHPVPNYRCPSDVSTEKWTVQLQPPNVNPDLPVNAATSNYIGSFGSTDFHPCASNPVGTPCVGNGVFYLNSRVSAADIRDGLSNTVMAGERATNQTVSPAIIGMWFGAPPGAVEAIGRVLGASDYLPNDLASAPTPHFEAYSSYHPTGVNMLMCDGRVEFVNQFADPNLFMGMATIAKNDNAIVFPPQ